MQFGMCSVLAHACYDYVVKRRVKFRSLRCHLKGMYTGKPSGRRLRENRGQIGCYNTRFEMRPTA